MANRPTSKTQAIAMIVGALRSAGVPIHDAGSARRQVKHGVSVRAMGREFAILTSGPEAAPMMAEARAVVAGLGWTRETYAELRANTFRVAMS